MKALDLFAGSGWGVACQWLGIDEHGVDNMPEVLATRAKAGMHTAYSDVWDGLFGEQDIGEYDLLIGSPPCQTFSTAGNGNGRKALSDVVAAVEARLYRDPAALFELTHQLGPKTALVLTPLAHVYRDRPMYVALEQVPSVLPVWEICAEMMRKGGYSVWTGLLHAEQYGVPQTRTRAILIARRDGLTAHPPTPTHSRYHSRDPKRLDPGVEKWISMAEALGWGMNARPYPTVATGAKSNDGPGAGGTDPAALGGSGARAMVYRERAEGRWDESGDADNDGGILRLQSAEAGALQTFPPFQSELITPEQAAIFQSYPWAAGRPATTIVADPRLGGPGRSEFVKGGVSRQDRPGSMVLMDEQASRLQSYPDGFPFQGSKSKKFLQIGNAVPPVLGWSILKEFA